MTGEQATQVTVDGKRYDVVSGPTAHGTYLHVYKLNQNGERGYQLRIASTAYMAVFNHYRRIDR